MVKRFSRLIEDFICEHCNNPVKGNGYTNHCPYCLYSKHVDEDPGDRAATCHGIMEPGSQSKVKGDHVDPLRPMSKSVSISKGIKQLQMTIFKRYAHNGESIISVTRRSHGSLPSPPQSNPH